MGSGSILTFEGTEIVTYQVPIQRSDAGGVAFTLATSERQTMTLAHLDLQYSEEDIREFIEEAVARKGTEN